MDGMERRHLSWQRGEQLEPLLASIHALNDELEVDPITTEDP
jgi:hypothetical protein